MDKQLLPNNDSSGFSLVEVALALGIIGFCAIALLGFLGVGYDAGRASADDTRSAMLYETVVRQLQAKPFNLPTPSGAPIDPPDPAEGSLALPLPALTGKADSTTGKVGGQTRGFYVDANDAFTAIDSKAVKYVKVTISNPPDLKLAENQSNPTMTLADGYLAQVTVDIQTPAVAAKAGSKSVKTITFVTEIGSWEQK